MSMTEFTKWLNPDTDNVEWDRGARAGWKAGLNRHAEMLEAEAESLPGDALVRRYELRYAARMAREMAE